MAHQATILPYRSTTASATPAAGNMMAGEMAVNAADAVVFLKDSGGTVQKVSDRIHAAALDALFAGPAGIVARTAAGVLTPRTITGTANRITVTAGDGGAANPTLTTPQDSHTGATPTYAGLTLTGRAILAGADLGYSSDSPSHATRTVGLHVPRAANLPDIGLDYLDEAYYLSERGATVTLSLAAGSGTVANLFHDDATTIAYGSGSSPFPLTITATGFTITAKADAFYAVALTFRSSGAVARVLPTNIKIEFLDNSSSTWSTAYDQAVSISGTADEWISPRLVGIAGIGSTYDLTGVRVTLSNAAVVSLTSGEVLSIQRLQIKHLTAAWDPWHLAAGGGTLYGTVALADGVNLAAGTTTGTKIGTATTQKVGFHNATPTVQRSGAAQAAVATTGATNTTPYGFATAAQADAIVTLVNELRAAATEKGLIKGSA